MLVYLRFGAIAGLVFATLCCAQTTAPVIPFQGYLANQEGLAIRGTASVALVFRLYDAPVGGVPKWEEIQHNVDVIGGRFSVLLGVRTPLPDARLFDRPLYLGITLDDSDSTTADIEMRPRQVLVPVIGAYLSRDTEKLNGHDWSDLLVAGANDPSVAKVRGDKVDLAAVEVKLREYDSRITQLKKDLDEARGRITDQKNKIDALQRRIDENIVPDFQRQITGAYAIRSVSTNHMAALRASCVGGDLACLAGAHRACVELGFLGGVAQEWSATNTTVLCIGRP
jgi:hypothetical protein